MALAKTGGVGSFAHEYGHFLDFFFGGKVDVHSRYYSLTGEVGAVLNLLKWI